MNNKTLTSKAKSRKAPTKSVSQSFLKKMELSLLKGNNDENEFETNLENFDVEQSKKQKKKKTPKHESREDKKNLRKLTS